MDPFGEAFEEIARIEDERQAHELGLVILSQGAPYWVLEGEGDEYFLVVQTKDARRLLRQIELYRKESLNWPPESRELSEEGASPVASMVWILVLLTAYGISLEWPQLFVNGKVSAEAVMEGQVYRVFTALFLHADIGHLAGNMLFGAVFLHLVARHIGGIWAWIGVLLAGSAGNYLNAAIYYPEPHYSLGASTAVFGAVGLLATIPLGFRLRYARWNLAKAWIIPFVIGLIFLAWFGTGDEQTDTSAHLTGFACGVPIGLAAGFFRTRLAD
ncbi:MAG: rhomboid family intramembrane serine protease [Puniceicoccaceae bacterium]